MAQRNPHTGEPYLSLSKSHPQIIITPPRMSDLRSVVRALNDPIIFRWMTGPPHPYLMEHGVSWLESQIKETDAILEHMQTLGPESSAPTIGCPFRILRQVDEDGNEDYLGYIGLYPSERNEIEDDGERGRVLKADAEKPPGDPSLLWDIAYYVVPSCHGKGIMTSAIRTILDEWGIPRLNVHKIQASILTGNGASVRVLEKTGFKLVRTIENYEEVRGEMKGVHWMEWTRP